MFPGPALSGWAWRGFAGNFLVFFNALWCVAVRWSRNVGKIFLTSAGRRHGPARIIGGPEGDGAARVAVPEPAPRAGHRSGVPGRGVLRCPRRGAGQVRDGAPRQRGRRIGHRDSRGVRVLPAVVLPGATALAASGLDGLVPARPGPRGGHKLIGQILAWAEQQLASDPALKPAGLAGPIAEAFGVCRLPAAWDHPEGFSATNMGPPGCQ